MIRLFSLIHADNLTIKAISRQSVSTKLTLLLIIFSLLAETSNHYLGTRLTILQIENNQNTGKGKVKK
jgi:hypothetical protein